MLLTIGFALVALWLIGVIAFPVIGWFIHVLLVIAIMVILIRIIKGNQ
ncbi:MAG: lmo0937 family membrane protein [Patescibacteria group bacterium]|nr:lmo0937 family membrane protein [Patescibacteria group bacterium]